MPPEPVGSCPGMLVRNRSGVCIPTLSGLHAGENPDRSLREGSLTLLQTGQLMEPEQLFLQDSHEAPLLSNTPGLLKLVKTCSRSIALISGQ